MVCSKRSDIAVLLTLGLSRWQIMLLFMIMSLTIAIIGFSLGVALGVLMSSHVTQIVQGLEHALGVQLIQQSVYGLNYLPSDTHTIDIIRIVAITLALVVLFSWYPSLMASRVKPARELRYE